VRTPGTVAVLKHHCAGANLAPAILQNKGLRGCAVYRVCGQDEVGSRPAIPKVGAVHIFCSCAVVDAFKVNMTPGWCHWLICRKAAPADWVSSCSVGRFTAGRGCLSNATTGPKQSSLVIITLGEPLQTSLTSLIVLGLPARPGHEAGARFAAEGMGMSPDATLLGP